MIKKLKSFLFENKSEKQVFLKNTFWLTAGNVSSRFIRALMIIYAARVLGTAGYGIFSYVLSLAGFFTMFSDFGLTGLLTRELVQKPAEVQRYIATTLRIKLVITFLSVLVTLFAAPLFITIDAARPLLPIVAVLLAFDGLRGFMFSITRAKNRMEIESGLSVTTDLLITGLGFAALFIRPTAEWLAIAYTAGSGLGFLIVFIIIHKWAGGLMQGFDRKLVKPLLFSAWPFAVMGLLGGLMINIDTIIIGWFRSADELGLYGAAQRPVQLFYLFPAFASTSLFPLFSKYAREKNHERMRHTLERAITGVFAAALPLTIGGVLLGQPVVQLIFGAQYLGATLTFQLLLTTVLTIFPGTVIGNAIFAYDAQKIFLKSVGWGALINVVLDLLFIPPYGIAGSAVATIIAQIVANGYVWMKLRQIISFKTFPFLGKITLASLGMGIAVWGLTLLHWNVIPIVALGIGVYAALLYALKEPLLQMIGVHRSR